MPGRNMSRTASNKNHHHHEQQYHASNRLAVPTSPHLHQQSKQQPAERSWCTASACVHAVTDRLASSCIGQSLLCRTLRTLHSVEMTVQWMLPDGERIDDASGKPNPWIVDKPSRPLPWILFLPAIVWMRMFIAGAKLHHRLTGRPPLYAWHIVVRLQSVQRTVRAIRHQGIRQQEQQRKLSYWQWALTIVGWRTASDEHAIAESEREKSRPPSSRASSVERHNDSIEDLLTKQYKSDGETSDESFQMPSDVNTDSETESEYNTSDYDSLSHSDGGSELTMDHQHESHRPHGGRPTHRSQQHADGSKPSMSANNKRKHSHQPNESTSGVESLDAPSHQRHYHQSSSHRAPPPTADQSMGTEEDEARPATTRSGSVPVLKADAVLRKLQEKNTGTPKRTVRELHSPTPGTPKITLVDFDEGSEPNNSLMLSESLILSDTVPLRAIENEVEDEHAGDGDQHFADGFSAPEMTKSKRRRMKKKSQQQQQHQLASMDADENKEN